jgi:hypothetical protein
MTTEKQNAALCAIWLTVLFLLLLLIAGCAGTPPPPVEKIVTHDVPVPYYQPCPAANDIPMLPKTVHEEHPVMPEAVDKTVIDQVLGASAVRERILAGKILEYQTYAERADAVMRACAAHPPPH